MQRLSPVTAAGPSRIHTGFPFKLSYEHLKFYEQRLAKSTIQVNTKIHLAAFTVMLGSSLLTPLAQSGALRPNTFNLWDYSMANKSRILITSIIGYNSRLLKERLLQRPELMIRLLVRNKHKVGPEVLSHAEVVEGDTFNSEALRAVLSGIEVAFYLITPWAGQGFRRTRRVKRRQFPGRLP